MTENTNTQNDSVLKGTKISRRDILKTAGVGGVGVILGASGLGGLLSLKEGNAATLNSKEIIPFYGEHQGGITTKTQNHVYFVSLDVTTSKKAELVKLFKDWTKAAALLTEGKAVGELSSNEFLPPKDTGEAAGLSPSNLTITFGVGPSLFVRDNQDRFGLKQKQPKELVDLPKFPLDALEEAWTGGDLCIQACADDLQVAFHAVRNLIRIARGKAALRWAQTGFQRTKQADPKEETPRNLFGFKDGSANPDVKSEKQMNEHVWVQPGDGPNWLVNGSYLVVRRIQMFIEVWDRSTLKEQEKTFGRYRDSGAPLGQKDEFEQLDFEKKTEQGEYIIPVDSHTRQSHGDGSQKILRRAYSYSDGMDVKTGSFDAGLLFLCFQRTPSKQFIPIQNRLAKVDKLNEYTSHRGSAIFACLPGARQGGFIGETLFH
ncbi:deferrochelatase/peroxidase EfeB [Neobacillus sp. MM2021_6]|uniref:iron uptake transporter deferrochelatase/peroxidase subunit n=1 Tax=Bacillaceae TaxID=186817 RepID=UPI0014075564|nr:MULTISPECIES: iron uptake transporter deferrochelatase/peroxidase subunit [Bacillaceae]MBO0960661.1 deferrochelatase/peroxidase EfeB [Neobacillus sp. MM2021_6]NHC18383.1 deferrochelatase/peroxidase EfeB [Bacillus sp. MM2020_4]